MKIFFLLFSICFVTLFSNAQVGVNSQWTWMNGDSTVNATGIYGIKGVPDPANKPGARFQSISWKDTSGNFWLFGGGGSSAGLNDLWKYNPSTNQWTWVSGDSTEDVKTVYGTKGLAAATNKPGARWRSVSWTDPSGNLWLFGGTGNTASNSGLLNDLWKYDPSTNLWTWENGDSAIFASGAGGPGGLHGAPGVYGGVGATPGTRYGSVSWTDVYGNLWLFGGRGFGNYVGNFSGNLDDLWKYETSTNQWTWVNGDNTINVDGIYGTQGIASPTNKPGGRYQSVSWKDNSGNLWLFGGSFGYDGIGEYYDFNDLWKYDPSTNQWAWMKGDSIKNVAEVKSVAGVYGRQGEAAPDNKPGTRDACISWTDTFSNLWLFGGEVYNSFTPNVYGLFNDLWKYDLLTNQWTWVKGDSTYLGNFGIYGTRNIAAAGNKPGSRCNSISWIDSMGNLWLFGGEGYAAKASSGYYGSLNDLWKLSNVSDLPVTLLDISASVAQKNILVKWQTSQEINSSYFNVERSTDGQRFLSIGSIMAAGNSSSLRKYSFTDQQPLPGTYYYRVKMVDIDGSYKYSLVVRITLDAAQHISIYPNPVISIATINLTTNADAELKFSLYDDKGSFVAAKQIFIVKGNNSFTVDMSKLSKGMYTAAIIWGSENKNIKILKN